MPGTNDKLKKDKEVRTKIEAFLLKQGLENKEGENGFYNMNGDKVDSIFDFLMMNPQAAFLVFNPEYPDNLTMLRSDGKGGFIEQPFRGEIPPAAQKILKKAKQDRKIRKNLYDFMEKKTGQKKGTVCYDEKGGILKRDQVLKYISEKKKVLAFNPETPDSLTAFSFENGRPEEKVIADKVLLPENIRKAVAESRHAHINMIHENLLDDLQLASQHAVLIMDQKMTEAEAMPDEPKAEKTALRDLYEEQYELIGVLRDPGRKNYEEELNNTLAALCARASVYHTIRQLTSSVNGAVEGIQDMLNAINSRENLKKLTKAMKTPEMLAALKKELQLDDTEKMAGISPEDIYDHVSIAAGKVITEKKAEEARERQEIEEREKHTETENLEAFDKNFDEKWKLFDFESFGVTKKSVLIIRDNNKSKKPITGSLTMDRRSMQTIASALMMKDNNMSFADVIAEVTDKNKDLKKLRKEKMMKALLAVSVGKYSEANEALAAGIKKAVAFLDEKLDKLPELSVPELLKDENRELMLALAWAKDFGQEYDKTCAPGKPASPEIAALEDKLQILSSIGADIINNRFRNGGMNSKASFEIEPASVTSAVLAGYLMRTYMEAKRKMPGNENKKLSELIEDRDLLVEQGDTRLAQIEIANILKPALEDPETKEGVLRGLSDSTLQRDMKVDCRIGEDGTPEFKFDLTKMLRMAKVRGHLAMEKQKAEEKMKAAEKRQASKKI